MGLHTTHTTGLISLLFHVQSRHTNIFKLGNGSQSSLKMNKSWYIHVKQAIYSYRFRKHCVKSVLCNANAEFWIGQREFSGWGKKTVLLFAMLNEIINCSDSVEILLNIIPVFLLQKTEYSKSVRKWIQSKAWVHYFDLNFEGKSLHTLRTKMIKKCIWIK